MIDDQKMLLYMDDFDQNYFLHDDDELDMDYLKRTNFIKHSLKKKKKEFIRI